MRDLLLRRRTRPPAKGAVAVEFALLVPIMVLLLTAVTDIGITAYESMRVQGAAEAGAQYAAKNVWDPAAIAAVVTTASGGGISASPAPMQFCACPDSGGLAAIDCADTCPGGLPPGRYAEVSAALDHETILPYPGLPSPLTLTGRAVVRLQ